MNLQNCHDMYIKKLPQKNRAFTLQLEKEAIKLKQLIFEKGYGPNSIDLERVKQFLIDVEKWKADCLEDKIGHLAERNANHQIWNALHGAITATTDLDALHSIMNLIGFGSTKDEVTGQRRAKRATAVLRFLEPDEWGVVDWRTVAFLGFFNKHKQNVVAALEGAKQLSARDASRYYEIIDEYIAIEIIKEYRSLRCSELPRTLDVELAIYGASFLPWPRASTYSRKTTRLTNL